MRDAFESYGGRGQFAGHETFPLRLLWLKKAYDAVEGGAPVNVFQESEAIARFGVGRNMALSMRHWALASGIVEVRGKQLCETDLGRAIFATSGWDPYLERASTLWLTHWNLASVPSSTTTIYFAFNAVAALAFQTDALVSELEDLVRRKGWRVAGITLQRDVEVFVRSYVRRDEKNLEDAAEPLLAELGLVRSVWSGGRLEFVHGPKPTLHDGVFAYAVGAFWNRHQANATSLSAEQICYAPGSPGRVFKLDEDSVVTRLMKLEQITNGAWIWTDTAGLRQVHKRHEVELLELLGQAYSGAKATRKTKL